MTSGRLAELRRTLSDDERLRGERLLRERDRRRFLAARGVLRDILARYLRRHPAAVRFEYSPEGKPAIAASTSGGIAFNLSHSAGMAVCAVCRDRRVGVDVEQIRPEIAMLEIADRVFAPRERTALRTLSPAMRMEAFFWCWTRKEAYVKAHGGGLSLPLDQVEVSLLPGEPPRLLRTPLDPHATPRWSLHDLFPAPGYVGALAVEGTGSRLHGWDWTG